MKRISLYRRFTIAVILVLFVGLGISSLFVEPETLSKNSDARSQRSAVSLRLQPYLETQASLPDAIQTSFQGEDPQTFHVKYTIDPHLQKVADDLLKRDKPDYSAIFMMDAKTGRVLVYSSFQKEGPYENLLQKATYPAASIFKIVTATAAFDKKGGVSPQHKIQFNGGNWTLYKKNVMLDQITRWTRTVSMREAFAKSMNTPFGKIGLQLLEPRELEHYAERFLFNRQIPTDFPVDPGVAVIPTEKNFELSEVASGYNKLNLMSPVQGAMIAATVVNGGKMMSPYMVSQLTDNENKVYYQGAPLLMHEAMTEESSHKVRELMEETIISGTSRRTFSSLRRNRKYSEIEMGGKTGHLTGKNPQGQVDWFVGYASSGGKQVAVGIVTVNKKFWTVKSSYLGQSLFKKTFEEDLEIANNR